MAEQQHAQVLDEVAKGKELKHTETVDKSAPQIPADAHVKQFDKKPLLNEIANDHELKHVETADRSDPKIDPNTSVKKNEHGALLAEIKGKGE